MTQPARSIAWGGAHAPLIPRVFRRLWAGDPIALPVGRWVDKGFLSWDELDSHIWRITTGNLKVFKEAVVRVFSDRFNQEKESLRNLNIFTEPWPSPIDPGQIPFRARTKNLLRKAGIASDPSALHDLTIGDVLDIPGAGVVSLLDLACSLEASINLIQSSAAVLDLRRLPWSKFLTVPDPRLTRFADSTLAGTMTDLVGKGALLLTSPVVELRKEVERIASLGFREAIQDYLAALLPDWDTDRIVGLSMRMGFDDFPPPTLQAIADILKLTRERVRQLEDKLTKRVKNDGPRPFLPKLDDAILKLKSLSPIAARSAEVELQAFDSRPLHPGVVVRAAEFFGRPVELQLVDVEGEDYVVATHHIHVFANAPPILKHARRQEQRYGAGNLSQLKWVLEGDGFNFEEAELESLLSVAPKAHLDNDGWFWFDVTGRHNSFVSTSRKMLSVNSPISVMSLRDGLRRRAAYSQRHIVPPKSVLKRLYAQSPHFIYEDAQDGLVRPTERLNAEEELGPVQLAMVRILQSAPYGILDRETFMSRCHAEGLNMSSVSIYTTYGECIERVAPNVWTARGTNVSPAIVNVFLDTSGTRDTPRRATGWSPSGRPWMVVEVNATMLGSPAIPTPKDLKRVLIGRDFHARTLEGVACGTITTDAGGSFVYGWSVFLRTAGADVGDFVRATFDLVEGMTLLELGGPELIPQ